MKGSHEIIEEVEELDDRKPNPGEVKEKDAKSLTAATIITYSQP